MSEIWYSHNTPGPLRVVCFHPGEVTSTQNWKLTSKWFPGLFAFNISRNALEAAVYEVSGNKGRCIKGFIIITGGWNTIEVSLCFICSFSQPFALAQICMVDCPNRGIILAVSLQNKLMSVLDICVWADFSCLRDFFKTPPVMVDNNWVPPASSIPCLWDPSSSDCDLSYPSHIVLGYNHLYISIEDSPSRLQLLRNKWQCAVTFYTNTSQSHVNCNYIFSFWHVWPPKVLHSWRSVAALSWASETR